MSRVAAIDHLRAPQPKSDDESINAFKEPLVILDQQLFEEIVAGPEETKVKDD